MLLEEYKFPFKNEAVSTQRPGVTDEYEPTDRPFCILHPCSIKIGEIRRIKDEVSDNTSVLVLTLKRRVADWVSIEMLTNLLQNIVPTALTCCNSIVETIN